MVMVLITAYHTMIVRKIKLATRIFPVTPNQKGDSAGIISFSKMSINSEGKIKSDSLFYLDEYLEVERGEIMDFTIKIFYIRIWNYWNAT